MIKVQYPNAATIFSADMQCLRMLVRLSQPEALPAFSEFSSQVSLELDYELEVSNLERIRAAVLPLYGNRVSVPKYIKRCAQSGALQCSISTAQSLRARCANRWRR